MAFMRTARSTRRRGRGAGPAAEVGATPMFVILGVMLVKTPCRSGRGACGESSAVCRGPGAPGPEIPGTTSEPCRRAARPAGPLGGSVAVRDGDVGIRVLVATDTPPTLRLSFSLASVLCL